MFFEEELIRLEEGRRFPVTVMVCDLDGLKQINDTEGHEAGDAAIRGIAHVLVRAFRNEDLIARIGGDEFAVILAETVPAMTAVVEKRLSRLLSLYNDEVVGDGLYRPLSLSFGIKTLELGQSLRDGLKAADERMYAMKSVHHAAE
jgi:diguanylate cyclase (GGDEF)-like protein